MHAGALCFQTQLDSLEVAVTTERKGFMQNFLVAFLHGEFRLLARQSVGIDFQLHGEHVAFESLLVMHHIGEEKVGGEFGASQSNGVNGEVGFGGLVVGTCPSIVDAIG